MYQCENWYILFIYELSSKDLSSSKLETSYVGFIEVSFIIYKNIRLLLKFLLSISKKYRK